MKTFLAALKAVSNVDIALPEGKSAVPEAWQLVLARALVAFVWGAVGVLVLWLLPGKGLVGVALATVAVVAVRWYLCRKQERDGMSAVYASLSKGISKDDMFSGLALQNVILLIRPALIFLLLWHGSWLWLVVAGALSMAVSLSAVKQDEKNSGWIAAAVLSLVIGAFASKIALAFGNLFLLGIVACIVSWLLAKFLEGKEGMSAESGLFIGEAIVLVIGIC